jgi:2-(1,2-epoxy-1,2-dihydrophenyl)acetyl-CoA isomerase
LIGWQKASAIMMLGDKISAAEAESMGMIYKSYTDDVFKEETSKLVQALSVMPTRGLAYTKQALNVSFINDFNTQLEAEDAFQQRAAQTADYKEGVDAFLAKRKPQFKGK